MKTYTISVMRYQVKEIEVEADCLLDTKNEAIEKAYSEDWQGEFAYYKATR